MSGSSTRPNAYNPQITEAGLGSSDEDDSDFDPTEGPLDSEDEAEIMAVTTEVKKQKKRKAAEEVVGRRTYRGGMGALHSARGTKRGTKRSEGAEVLSDDDDEYAYLYSSNQPTSSSTSQPFQMDKTPPILQTQPIESQGDEEKTQSSSDNSATKDKCWAELNADGPTSAVTASSSAVTASSSAVTASSSSSGTAFSSSVTASSSASSSSASKANILATKKKTKKRKKKVSNWWDQPKKKVKTQSTNEIQFVDQKDDVIEVKEQREFAGKVIEVTRELPKNSKAAQQHMKKKRKSGHLDAVLAEFLPKKKLSTVEKTEMDWKVSKEEEKDGHELEQWTKSSDALIAQKDFLLRSDWREYGTTLQTKIMGQKHKPLN